MSVSVKYQPVTGKTLNLRSSGFEKLRRALGYDGFGEMTVTASDDGVLRGLAAALDPDERAAIEELREAIQKHDAIRVWGEY